MKIALASINQKWEDKIHNLNLCESIVKRAKENFAEIIIFPEMTLTGFTMNTEYSAEDKSNSFSIKAFSKMAKKNNIFIIAGIVFKYKNKVTNSAVAISNKGTQLSQYNKIHLFSFANENIFFTPGKKLSKFIFSRLTVGLTICYDLRFPEIYSALAKNCEMIINIANWPKERLTHWRKLLDSRAIENQIIMVGVNRTGKDGNNFNYELSSRVIDFNGDLIKPFYSHRNLDIYDIDYVSNYKRQVKFLIREDRRTDFYKKII